MKKSLKCPLHRIKNNFKKTSFLKKITSKGTTLIFNAEIP